MLESGELEARPSSFLNFKGTPSQEEHKTFWAAYMTRWLCLIKLTFCIFLSPEDDLKEFHQF
jgi:hypothetical protein